jgi:hypothetical protein
VSNEFATISNGAEKGLLNSGIRGAEADFDENRNAPYLIRRIV